MLKNHEKYYTQLDKDLQALAINDWPAFVLLVGEQNILAAKICILRNNGKSYNQIAAKLNSTRGVIRYKSESCICK